jgi:DNA-binding NtrC family response regulator
MEGIKMENLSPFFNRETTNRKHSRKVLIVEDDLFLAAIVGRAVYDINADSEIDWATSLEQAMGKVIQSIDHIGQSPYELVIADIMLEGRGTGLDLWKVFCKTYPNVPVVVMSSLSEKDVKDAIGVDAQTHFNFLKKPFSMGDLKTNIKEIFA